MKKLGAGLGIALILSGMLFPFSFNVARAQTVPIVPIDEALPGATAGPKGGTGVKFNPPNTNTADTTPDCGLGGYATGGKDSSVLGCVAQIMYFLVYYPSFLILTLTAYIFDWGVSYSIKDTSYTNDFLSNGWAIVRDISNILFIFALLWIAIGLILGLPSVHPKKDIAMVIIIALVINFSLFITRTIVDTGNILSYVFYNNISVVKSDCTEEDCNLTSEITKGDKSLSTKIAASVKISKLIGDSGFHPGVAVPCDPTSDTDCDATTNEKPVTGSGYAGSFIFMTLIMTIFNVVLAWALFTMAFLFIGRVVAIWIAMIFSPFAFISYTIPGMASLPTIGNKAWWGDLLGAVFFAPIFMFFLYLILQFLGAGVINTITASIISSGSMFGMIMSMVMPFAIIMALILTAKSFSVKMAGEAAGIFVTAGTAVGGLALGAATGGAALLAQRTVGSSAAAKLKDEGLKNAASGNQNAINNLRASNSSYRGLSDADVRKKAEGTLKTAQKNASRSFDFRQTGIGQQMSNATGMNMGGVGRFATGNLAGGIEGAQARKAEKDRKFAESLGFDAEEYENQKTNLETRKNDVERAQDRKTNLQQERQEATTLMQNLKDRPGGLGSPSYIAAQRRVTAADEQIRNVNGYIDRIKNGGDTGVVDGLAQRNYTIGTMAENEKAVENIKKARMKEYYGSKMRESGYAYGGETRDDLGNINRLGHLDTGNRPDARQWGRDFWNSIKSGAIQGGIAGTLLGLPTGLAAIPIGIAGALVGSIKGAVTGGMLPGIKELVSSGEAWATRNNLGIGPLNIKLQSDLAGTKILAEGAHIASDESHKIHTSASKYKSPSKGFFAMFEGLAKESGGGGGGGGGGDHGGGHH